MNPSTGETFGATYLETVPVTAWGGCPLTDRIRVIDPLTGDVIDGIDYFRPSI